MSRGGPPVSASHPAPRSSHEVARLSVASGASAWPYLECVCASVPGCVSSRHVHACVHGGGHTLEHMCLRVCTRVWHVHGSPPTPVSPGPASASPQVEWGCVDASGPVLSVS